MKRAYTSNAHYALDGTITEQNNLKKIQELLHAIQQLTDI